MRKPIFLLQFFYSIKIALYDIISYMKRKLFFIIPAAVIGIPVLAVVLLFLFLTIVEYRPKPIEDVPFTSEKACCYGKLLFLL